MRSLQDSISGKPLPYMLRSTKEGPREHGVRVRDDWCDLPKLRIYEIGAQTHTFHFKNSNWWTIFRCAELR